MNNSLFIGRFQKFHNGHKKLIESVLKTGKPVVVAVRDTEISKENPYVLEQRIDMVKSGLKEWGKLVKVIQIPDIDEVVYGRKVGYRIRQIGLDRKTEGVSGTKTRQASFNRIFWMTGNTGSGKTTLAYLLRERVGGVVLDGDAMRASISEKAGYSKKDRDEHNLRVARLAKVLWRQRIPVIVSVIAPFRKTRAKIEKIIEPEWIYIKRRGLETRYTPYEPPLKPKVVVDTDKYGISECVEQIWEAINE